ncbi:MAG: T9SS type A sorting domain-containing protein, partial [Schleiferiaceae bacterium]|nr:T9SS type A sorting domain-containing protein [Schleiferiaceae bacterium]
NGVFLSNTPVANGHYALINGQAYSYAQLQSSTFAFDGNNALANPDFVDVATADFTPTSAAHSQIGTDMLVRVAEDFFGVARTATPDPGAIEFVPLRCQGIVNFDIDSSDVDAVHLSWSSSESSFEFWYGLQGTTPGDPNGATTLLMQKDFSLLNLPLNVCLDLYVRELCDSTSSSWAGPLLFCTPANIDVALSQLVTPADEACGQSNQLISAWVVNLGIQPVNEIPLTLDVTGNVTQSINYTWFGNLPAGDSVQVTFGTVNTQRGGVLNFKLWSTVANDGNANNDTISTALLLFPDSIEVTQRHWCDSGDPAFFDAPPIPGVEYAWYESISQVTPSFVGNSFAAGNQQPGFTVYVDYNNSNCLNNRQPITLMATGAPQSDFTHAENQLAVTFYFQGANADSLFWTFGNGLGTGLGDSVTFVFPYAWTFPVCVYAFNRCGVDTLCKSVAVTGAVSTEFFEQNSFRWELFPNPTKDIVTLQFDGLLYNEFFVQLTNAAGQQVLEIHNTCNGVCNTQFDVSGLSAGVYFIAVAVKDAVWRHRLIIAK